MTTKADASPAVVEFYYDIICPFAYIASTRIDALAARAGGAAVAWRPVLLGGIYRATAAPQGAEGSATDPMNNTKRAVFARAFARTLRRLGIPLNPPPGHPRRSVDALRLLHRLPDGGDGKGQGGARAAVTRALYRAYWVDGVDIADRAAVLRVARTALDGMTTMMMPGGGGGGDGRQAAVLDLLDLGPAVFDDGEAKRALTRATEDAVARGAPGVPGFWIPDEVRRDARGRTRRGRLYWGQDRMHFVEASLLRLQQRSRSSSVAGVPRLSALLPRCREPARLRQPVRLEFWFDFSSPWAYLGWTRLEYLREVFGSHLEIDFKPIVLGVLFKEIGAPQMPSMVTSAHKRQYSLQDLFDWVAFWNTVDKQQGLTGRSRALHWPDVFPIRSPTLLKCAVADASCIPTLYEACWAKNLDVSDESVLTSVLEDAGYDAGQLLAEAASSRVKEILRANTGKAKEAGFCGVPTYRVFHHQPDGSWKQGGAFVWGQDEMAVVEDLIAGWDENSSETAEILGEKTMATRARM
ncbi:thioredoxin-like protein [Xylariaceae sp. FL0804]|nr:thioredoxin-like protein [Xylariaceae sp. FL0804]